VVVRPGTTIDAGELLRFCSAGLPDFKAPKRIVVSPSSLPKTERGKLDRRALVERWTCNSEEAPIARQAPLLSPLVGEGSEPS
jgi:acyl-CoA synthetase (AMP-forming)/AMP-acid ligase II